MVLVLSFQLLTGTGLFCAGRCPNTSRSLGDDRTTIADHGSVSTSAPSSADSQSRKVPCGCKDPNRCPPIACLALILNLAQELVEVQRQPRALLCDSVVANVLVLGLASSGAPLFTDLIGITTPYSPPPLTIISVLLI
jgi:hypothetical protein